LKSNCHINEKHIEGMKTKIEKKPFPFPNLSIKEVKENINDYHVEDFVVIGYQHHDPIKFQMVV